uniref:L-rhamnose-binding lectin CSL3-like n=1 Tax=Sinocyclocheilus grahami TaxID=75366 RepID=A0A672MY47_SINGR
MSLSLNRCDGLRTCGLNTQGLSTPDPCFGTYKYYTTNYICIPAGLNFFSLFLQFHVTCHGGYGYLKCSDCNGLENCEVYATHMIFTDPCFGTYKYLAISYFCLPHGILSSLVCEHKTSALTCEHGTVIHIHSANYGRTDSSTCSTGRPPAQLAKTDCYSLNSHTTVASRCEGKRSCSILASNSVFSDPCFGTFKYLYISYSCVSKCKCYCT